VLVAYTIGAARQLCLLVSTANIIPSDLLYWRATDNVFDFTLGRGGNRLITRITNENRVENKHNALEYMIVMFCEDFEDYSKTPALTKFSP
jgi:hypothetical protein